MPMTEDEMWAEIEKVRVAFRARNTGAELDELTLGVIAGALDGLTADDRWVELRKGSAEGSRLLRVMQRGPQGPELVCEWEGRSVLTGLAGLLEGPLAAPAGPLN